MLRSLYEQELLVKERQRDLRRDLEASTGPGKPVRAAIAELLVALAARLAPATVGELARATR